MLGFDGPNIWDIQPAAKPRRKPEENQGLQLINESFTFGMQTEDHRRS